MTTGLRKLKVSDFEHVKAAFFAWTMHLTCDNCGKVYFRELVESKGRGLSDGDLPGWEDEEDEWIVDGYMLLCLECAQKMG